MSQTQDQAARRNVVAGAPLGKPDLVVVAQPSSAAAEAYRSLRATVKFTELLPPLHTILIADAGTEGQHPGVTANLAAALALGGDRVTVVDAAIGNPGLHQLFGLANDTGVGEWLAAGDGTAPLPLVETGVPGLRLLPAGHLPGQLTASDLLGSERGSWLIERLRESADFVVIDAAPLPGSADALAVAPRVDGVLLLVQSGKTKRQPAQRAKSALERVGARLLGAVLTETGGRLAG